MAAKTVLTGNQAAAEGARLSRVEVVAAYPITPQSQLAEMMADFVADGSLKAEYIRIESEHSALSAVVGASMVGARAFTATASHGLAYMHEIIPMASGLRTPIVMVNVNRPWACPHNLWCDHSDVMPTRDMGWIQLFAENCQEALDFVILGYRLAEDARVRLPVMVNMDGFYLSHLADVVYVPEQEAVDQFLPPFEATNPRLDPDCPSSSSILLNAETFPENRYFFYETTNLAGRVMAELGAEFGRAFGRPYDVVEEFYCDDAEIILVTMGSISGTAKEVVEQQRKQGVKVGLLKIICYRPFPAGAVASALKKARGVAVIERSPGHGSFGPVTMDVTAALFETGHSCSIVRVITGLGGRDVPPENIVESIEHVQTAVTSGTKLTTKWVGLKKEEVNICG